MVEELRWANGGAAAPAEEQGTSRPGGQTVSQTPLGYLVVCVGMCWNKHIILLYPSLATATSPVLQKQFKESATCHSTRTWGTDTVQSRYRERVSGICAIIEKGIFIIILRKISH